MTAASNPPPDKEHTGENEIFGPYEVFERLGVGGMATVHRAKERGIEGFERIVALKRLLPHLAEDASFVRSFVREAKLASLLRHANIVQLYELGRVGAVYFIAMELIEGRDVRKLLRQARRVAGPPPLSVFISLMSQLCDALDYAHKRTDESGQPLGIVHRDVSPSNLIITDSGHLKIIDFGIAKAQTEQLRTQTGRIKGKLAYMAPEAIRGYELDGRSDVWAAGVIAHELLTARPLFASKNEYQTLMRVQSSEIAPPSKYNENCPSEVDDVVLMALARDPNERWQTAAEFRDGLEYIRSHFQLSATPGDVAEWMTWAFSQKGSTTSSFGAQQSSSQTLTPSKLSGPARAFARARSRSLTGSMKAASASEIEEAQAALQQAETAGASALDIPTGGNPTTGDLGPAGELEEPQIEVQQGVDSEEEEAVSYAWGNQEQDEGKPLLLDEVPDVSSKSIPVAEPRPATADPAVATGSFGAGIVAESQQRNRNKLVALVSIVAAIVGVAVYFLVIKKPDKAPVAKEIVPTTGIVKFRVEPANATVAVLGYGKHEGTPYELEVDAPGLYSIEISAEGHKTYVTEFQVEAGVKQILAVALQEKGGSDKAQVKLESTPAGKKIYLDGQDTGFRTPHTVEMTPETHTIALHDDAGEQLWSHEFVADLDKQYVFQPVLADLTKLAAMEADKAKRESSRARRERQKRRLAARQASKKNPTKSGQPEVTIPVIEEVGGSDPDKGNTGSALGSMDKISSVDTIAPPIDTKPVEKKPIEKKPVEKKPVEKKPVEKSKPINILPHEAKKVKGAMPSVNMKDPPKVGAAKLCIDTKGRVTSVRVLSKFTTRAKSDVKSALKKWRYKTHRVNGKAVSACFAVNFRIKT